MKSLNATAIAAAYFRFVGHFLLLMLSIILVICALLSTIKQQAHLLGVSREDYDGVLFTQRVMGQKVDSIYLNLSLLNKSLVRNDRQIAQRVLRQKDELNDLLLNQKPSERRYHEVYRRMADCVNEMLVLKDSIHTVEKQVQDARRDFTECQQKQRK